MPVRSPILDPLTEAITLARKASYNEVNKAAWIRKGTAVLRRLAKDLDLTAGTFEVRTCKGGVAVAGDVILHTDTFYVNLSGFSDRDAGYARTCKGRKDYTGGRNLPVPTTYEGLVRLCREIA